MNTSTRYRHLFVIIMLMAFFAQTFNNSFVIADYYRDSKAYATACINKAHPQMHCNGKCQMMKRLSQEEKKDQQAPERKENKNDIIFLKKTVYAIAGFPIAAQVKKYCLFNAGKETKMPRSVFHPPAC